MSGTSNVRDRLEIYFLNLSYTPLSTNLFRYFCRNSDSDFSMVEIDKKSLSFINSPKSMDKIGHFLQFSSIAIKATFSVVFIHMDEIYEY